VAVRVQRGHAQVQVVVRNERTGQGGAGLQGAGLTNSPFLPKKFFFASRGVIWWNRRRLLWVALKVFLIKNVFGQILQVAELRSNNYNN
jgi:hypothetical protein